MALRIAREAEGGQHHLPPQPLKVSEWLPGVQSAAHLIDVHLAYDEKVPDLWDLFISGTSSEYIADTEPPLYKQRTLVLPAALLEQFPKMECACFMGLFPEIHRAWLTLDNRIFLWDYADGSDFVVYDALDQIITAVALVPPRSDVFIDSVKHLLVLATPVEVVCLAVQFGQAKEQRDLTLHPTEFVAPTDNVNILKIVGTHNGRIFLCGKDGSLSELVYQAESGWFRRQKCRRLNHTRSVLSAVVPSFLRLSTDAAIIDVAVDDERHILYTLSERSSIQVYDLGADGTGMRHITTLANIWKEAARLCPRGHIWSEPMFQLVALMPVPSSESGPVHLVAITSRAIRLYFTTSAHQGSSRHYVPGRPTRLDLLHVRLPPSSDMLRATSSRSSPRATMSSYDQYGNVHAALYSAGVFLFADGTDGADSLVATSPDIAPFLKHRENGTQPGGGETAGGGDGGTGQRRGLVERFTCMEVDGTAWALAEEPARRLSPVGTEVDGRLTAQEEQLRSRNELAMQHAVTPRQFLCLTPVGLHVLVRHRPIDVLAELLRAAGGGDSKPLADFQKRYGKDQVCEMCLWLACGLYSPPSSSSADPLLVQWATRAFFRYGGEPVVRQVPSPADTAPTALYGYGSPLARQPATATATPVAPAGTSAATFGLPIGTPYVEHSGSHAGLCMMVARLLRPVWNQPITSYDASQGRAGLKLQTLRLRRDESVALGWALMCVRDFLQRNPHFGAGPQAAVYKRVVEAHVRVGRGGDDDEARRQEQRSAGNVRLLVERSLEALHFLVLLHDHRFARIVARLPTEEAQQRLANMKFRELVASVEGADMAKALTAALLETAATPPGESGEAGVDALADQLLRQCPHYFSMVDHLRFKALDMLAKARSAASAAARQALLDGSLKLLLQVVAHLDISAICSEFLWLRYYPGVVDLVLARAKAIDPTNAALSVWPARASAASASPVVAPTHAEPEANKRYEQRRDTYEQLNPLLAELFLGESLPDADPDRRPFLAPEDIDQARAATEQLILSSTDELFHYYFYSWLVDHGLETRLLDYDTPFIVPFLEPLSEKREDLLWRWFVKHQQYTAAAERLGKLADRPNVTLRQRLEYLSHALANAKSGAAEASELLYDLQERLEVAQLQLKVQLELASAPSATEAEQTARLNAAKELDSQLFTVSELFNKFANPFRLNESMLAIIHCSGYNDPNLVKTIWQNIVEDELKRSPTGAAAGSVTYGLEALAAKVLSLGRQYYPSELAFPLGFVCELLERKSLEYSGRVGWDESWVRRVLREIGVPHAALFEVYNRLFESSEQYWKNPKHMLHLLRVLYGLLSDWIDFLRSPRSTAADWRQFEVQRTDKAIEKYVSALDKLPSERRLAEACAEGFRALHASLTRY